MAQMNDFICIGFLDQMSGGVLTKRTYYCYRTPAKTWTPTVYKPNTVRLNLDGALDAAYGKGRLYEFIGDIGVPITAPSIAPKWTVSTPPDPSIYFFVWGNKSNLEASINSTKGVYLRTHEGAIYTAHFGTYKIRSLSPNWYDTSNTLYYSVKMQGAPGYA